MDCPDTLYGDAWGANAPVLWPPEFDAADVLRKVRELCDASDEVWARVQDEMREAATLIINRADVGV